MRILLIEDEPSIRENLKRNLEAECYAVDSAVNGEEGIRMARLYEYDLLILDNLMPKKTGLEVCYELRTERYTTPILLLSVQSDTEIKVRALDAGADDYLTKPFSLQELLARIRAVLRRQPAIQEEVLSAGELRIDLTRHTAHSYGKELTLTKKEFMLLAYLMQHQGIVLSRGMIMEHVWDMNADPFSNTIESHIASLRKKIRGDTNVSYITTISGRGYRFELS